MPNNKKSKCQQLFIVGCLSLFIVLQTAHVVICDEEAVDVAVSSSTTTNTIVSESSSSTTSSKTTTAPTHISSTLNNVPSSTIGSMITASVVPQEAGKEHDDNDTEVRVNKAVTIVEHMSSLASTEATHVTKDIDNEKPTTAEPIPSSLPLFQHTTLSSSTQVATNESDFNLVSSTIQVITTTANNKAENDEPISNEIHENEIIDENVNGVSSINSARVKIADIVTNHNNEFSVNNNNNQKTSKKPINIDDFYPSKMEDFKMVIQQSNEKLLREKEMLRNDDDETVNTGTGGDEMNNPLLKPMDLLPIISDKKDLLLEDRNNNGSDIATTNIEIELIEPDATKVGGNSEEREAVDITEKLQENDEVIKKIEESFKIDDMDLRPDIVFDVIPSKSSTVPTTIETKVMSTTTTTTVAPSTTTPEYLAPRSHHIPQESGFIPRRVKKNDPKIEGKISVLNRATLKRIDFANTKFKSHPNKFGVIQHNVDEQQSTNKYKSSSSSTGASSAEFSTTKFYNSKETDINKSNDSNNNNNQNTVVQTTVMAPISEKATNTIMTTTTTTNSININNDNNKKSTTIANVQTDDDSTSATISSTDSAKDIAGVGDSNNNNNDNNNKNSNNKNVVDMSITANVYPADTVPQQSTQSLSPTADIETLHPTIKIPVFHPLLRPRVLSRLQEKINQLDCDLQSFPPQLPQNAASGLPGASEEYIKIWRGNETHELNLPIVVSTHTLYKIAFIHIKQTQHFPT